MANWNRFGSDIEASFSKMVLGQLRRHEKRWSIQAALASELLSGKGTMPPIFCAIKRFSPATSADWKAFLIWSGLTQLREVISLDGILCPLVPPELTPEDWHHNVHADNLTFCFHDLDYLLGRVGNLDEVNVLAVMKEPVQSDIEQFSDPRFEFAGFDLIEQDGTISALVNCGGFPRAFANSELSIHGLLRDHARAIEVQQALKREYPASHHAYCDIWAIWRMKRRDSKFTGA